MIHYEQFTLDNGLRVFVHKDHTTPMAAVNILYNVGSRDEDEQKTGFAHLFEHLMFGGSQNVPSYDAPLQKVGSENNAFTSPDITNYYITLPANNLETAFWLESDRMMGLSFDPQVLEVQRKVVIEEFKQRYLNQPYGDMWLKLRPLAYQVHPYRWATIGKEISHIENATLDDVKHFFFKYYVPNNAILVVAGRGKWARLYQKLLKEQQLFANINASLPPALESGMLLVQGTINEGVSLETADAAVEAVLQEIVEKGVSESELTKVKNQAESTLVFSEIELLSRAMNLAYAANADWLNGESERIQAVTTDDVQQMAAQILRKSNSSTLYYQAAQVVTIGHLRLSFKDKGNPYFPSNGFAFLQCRQPMRHQTHNPNYFFFAACT